MIDPDVTLYFWMILATLIGLALIFVLPTLLRRDRSRPEGARGGSGVEDRRGRWAGYVLAGGIPPLALGLYLVLGSPAALNAQPGGAEASPSAPGPAAEAAPGEAGPATEAGLETLLPDLEARVRDQPADREAWSALGRAYGSLGRYDDALKAFVEATRLGADDAEVWSGYAEALAITRGHSLEGDPYQMLLKALERDPDDLKGLELIGVYHFQQGNYGQASFYWRRLAKLLPPDTPFARDIAGAAAEATARARAVVEELPASEQEAGAPASPPP
jgi:cytochrome c-type biogenesis protein CcmH